MMNDRYLYKAKFDDSDRWIIGYMYGQNGNYCIMPKDTGGVIVDGFYASSTYAQIVREDTICQCTGLKDKNGKLIWENDIVRYTDMITGVDKIDCIKWNETHASFVRLHISQMGLQYLNIDEFIANGCEVIGSEIDNPELLEVGE